jgi:hypothetical protein
MGLGAGRRTGHCFPGWLTGQRRPPDEKRTAWRLGDRYSIYFYRKLLMTIMNIF